MMRTNGFSLLWIFPVFIFIYAILQAPGDKKGVSASPDLTDSSYSKEVKLDTLLTKDKKQQISRVSKEVSVSTAKKKKLEENKEENHTFSYFLLASALAVVIAVLPRIQELSLNKDGLTLKLLDEMDEQMQELEAMVQPPKAGARQQILQEEMPQALEEKVKVMRQTIQAYKKLL